ncbi:NDP-sugar synthase [candidate division KSB1 bacterium]
MKAMILAAGLGTRLKPLTDHTPKAMIHINGKPMIFYIIDSIRRSGIKEIIINIHHLADQIVDYIENQSFKDINIEFSDERSELLDTGGGINKASWFLNGNESFLVHNVDIFTNLNLKDLIQNHNDSRALCTLAVSNRKTSRYLLFDDLLRLRGWKNIKTGEIKIPGSPENKMIPLAFSGIQVLSPEIFHYFNNFALVNKRFSIIEVYLQLSGAKLIKGFNHTGGKWIDMGKKESYPLASGFFEDD